MEPETDSGESDVASTSSLFGSLNVNNDSLTPYSDATKCRKLVKHVKRPMNPFMVWSQAERRKIMELQPNLHNAEVSKHLGHTWKLMSPAERKPWIKESERLRQFHSQEYPNYKYKPKKRKSQLQIQTQVDSNYGNKSKKEKCVPLSGVFPVNNTEKSKAQATKLFKKTKEIAKNTMYKKLNHKSNFNVKNESGTEFTKCKTSNPSISLHEPSKLVTKSSISDKGTDKTEIKKKCPKTDSDDQCSTTFKERKCNYDLSDKPLWDNLREIDVTSLAVDRTNVSNLATSTSELLKSNPLNKKSLPLYIDGCLTSGSIAALSCYRDNWAETFDYLTDKVLQNSKNIYEEIDSISTEYAELLKKDIKCKDPPKFIPEELKIPDINEVLGKNWKDPNFGLRFLS